MRGSPELLQLLRKYAGALPPDLAPQAADVARCLQGTPLSTSFLQEKVRPPEGYTLTHYSAPEAGASRDLMSDVCRLELHWEAGAGAGAAGGPAPPRSVFYKRIVMGDLAHARLKAKTAPKKLARDVRSYTVENAFLGSRACQALVDAGIPVARAFSVEMAPCVDDPIESRFALLLEDFAPGDGWGQHRLLNADQAKATLSAFAKLHGFFWDNSAFWRAGGAAAEELEAAVWPSGGYWQPAMQPAEQMDEVAAMWDRHRASFGAAFEAAGELEGVDLATLGERLQSVAREVGAAAHPFSATDRHGRPAAPSAAGRTLLHGDGKSANIFLRGAGGDVEVGLIDFQWAGFGLAATEVAHHIFAALDMDCLSYDGSAERDMLDFYYDELLRALVEFGAAGGPEEAAALLPREALQEQYETAVLDMCRVVFAYQVRETRSAGGGRGKDRD